VIFHWPQLLWLLAPLVVLAFLDAVRRRHDETGQPWPKILRAWAGARSATVGEGPGITRGRLLLWLGLAFGVMALARPQWGRIEEPVFDQSREIVIALDLSRSMQAPDVVPSRLERARLLIQGLLDSLRGERVGLVVFAGTAFLQVPLSADYEVLNEFLPSLTPAHMPVGGTDYGAMLRAALDAFSAGSAADRFLIVLSDGESLTDNWQGLVGDLRKANVRVIGLGVGTAQGAFIPDGAGGYVKDDRGAVVLSKLNSSTLRELAAATQGVYIDASSWVDLGAVLKQTVEAGRRGEFKEKTEARQIERFQWALAPALLCLLLSLWREFPVRPRARSLPLAARGETGARRQEPGRQPAAAAIAVILLLGACSLLPGRLRAAEDVSAFAAPLSSLVEHLSAQPGLSAADCATLAQETVTWGGRLREAQQAVPPGPVRDALLGVDVGEKLGPKAADWPRLRGQLEELLKKSGQPPPQPKPQPQNQQQQQQSQSQQQQSPESPPPQKQEPPPPQPPPPDKQESNPPPERANTGDTQRIGGQTEPPGETKTDPSLALPIQKLDQLRNQDSPAELFQMLDSRMQKPPPKKGRDW
jgi:Ca-activated chloride channel family protein